MFIFLGILKKAVDLNETLITEDQAKFQAALRKGLEKFEEQTQRLVNLNKSITPSTTEPQKVSFSRKHGTVVMELSDLQNPQYVFSPKHEINFLTFLFLFACFLLFQIQKYGMAIVKRANRSRCSNHQTLFQ